MTAPATSAFLKAAFLTAAATFVSCVILLLTQTNSWWMMIPAAIAATILWNRAIEHIYLFLTVAPTED